MDYRAEELAIKAGTTVRNLRAYRDHGLLEPPERRGRYAVYNDSHPARRSSTAPFALSIVACTWGFSSTLTFASRT